MVVSACEKQGTKVCIIPFYNDYIPARATLETVGGCKLINIRATPLDNLGAAALKRALDIAGSLFGLIVLQPADAGNGHRRKDFQPGADHLQAGAGGPLQKALPDV